MSPEIMKRMVSVLSRYYDHVLIDCPAGVGSGFMSAVASAQRALVVSTPDPVCLRDCNKTRIALEYAGAVSYTHLEAQREQNFDPAIEGWGRRFVSAAGLDRIFEGRPRDL